MKVVTLSHLMTAIVCRELLVGASTHDVVDATGMHIVTIRALLKAFRKMGLLVVIRWDMSPANRPVRRVYRFRQSQEEQDVPCPLKPETLERRAYKQRKLTLNQ